MRALALAAVLILAAAPALAADPAHGEWLTQSGTAKVKMAPCASDAARLCGNVSWVKDAASAKATDTNNPDAKLKTRPIMGLPMLWGFKSSAPGKWTGGKIYDPQTGKTYDSKVSVNPNGTLKVEGCVAVICQAQTWKKG
jgi:uncharacterized protein (DUF2147 family)